MKPTNGVRRIEEQMSALSPETLRYRVLESAKNFKNSWIELGQYLYAVYKDKLYKDWGYLTFEAYCAKEIGIRQPTAMKLLKSYHFLETDEPQYLKKRSQEETKPTETADLDSVNALRLVRANENVPEKDYEKIREEVLDKGQEPAEVKKKIKYLLKTAPAKEAPLEERKAAAAKKITFYLENTLTELTNLSFPTKVIKKLEEFLDAIGGYKP